MDGNFFIADKLRGIPLVSSGKSRADDNRQQQQEPHGSQMAALQLGKRDVGVGDSASSRNGILFKSVGITASTSNVRKQQQQTSSKPTTTKWRTSTTTTRRPPTTTVSTARRKAVPAAVATTRKPAPRHSPNTSATEPTATTSTTTTTTAGVVTISSTTTTRSASTRAEDSRTTLKKFDKLISQLNQEREEEPELDQLQRTTRTHIQLPLATQSAASNQRRTQQPILGPQRFNDGRSQSAGPNWFVFNRPDGGYSLFEILVLLSSIIMVSTIVLVIISNWVKAFRRKRQKLQPPPPPPPKTMGDDTGSRPASTSQPTDAGEQARKSISMISSGGLTTTTANGSALSDLSTSAASPVSAAAAAKPEATVINMVQARTGEALKLSVVGAAQNISSEIKQAAASSGNKAMAIVQPTENNPTRSAATTGAADSISVMSDPSADKMAAARGEEVADLMKKQNIGSRSASDLSAAHLSNKQEQPDASKGSALLEELFNCTDGKKSDGQEKRAAASSRVGSLESIELPPTLVDSIKRSEGARKSQAPADEAPSPNLLLGEREPKPDTSAAAQPRKETPQEVKPAPNGVKKEPPKKRDEEQRPANPMGRDDKPANKKNEAESSMAKPAARKAPATSSASTKTTTTTTTTTVPTTTAEVKNHQVVVNKLDKRKTNLEIVDLRDESVTGKMRKEEPRSDSSTSAGGGGNWISMDGVAVVQPAAPTPAVGQLSAEQLSHQQQQQMADQQAATGPLMSPSEIIESRFHVDYKSKRAANKISAGDSKDSQDSKATDYATNNIENELEQDNKMRNRKYFVYIVHDGHFTAKKECIARIELPAKRRITLAEMRHLIANSQDISLTSLRRNRFKFVTETYRLLNENEDATVLHQVYPTQGVFLKLNIPEQENQAYAFKRTRPGAPGGAGRLSTGSAGFPASGGGGGSSIGNTTISSRQRTGGLRQVEAGLPAIEVDSYALGGTAADRARASSVGRRNRQPTQGGSYRRTKSNLGPGNRRQQQQGMAASQERLPSIDMIMSGEDDDLSAADKRRPFIGQPIAVMTSDDKMRILTPSKYCSRVSCGRLANIRCGVCDFSQYCGLQCRNSDWPRHKQFCKRPRWKNWS